MVLKSLERITHFISYKRPLWTWPFSWSGFSRCKLSAACSHNLDPSPSGEAENFQNHPVLVPSNSSSFDASLPASSHHWQRAETTTCLPHSARRSPWLLNHTCCLQVLLHTSLQEEIRQPLCPHITRTPFSSFREHTPCLFLSHHLHVLKVQILPRACPMHPWLSPRCLSRSFHPVSTAQFQKYSYNFSSSLPGASLRMHDKPHKLPALK